MSELSNTPVPPDLRRLTPARVSLERTGTSLATRHALEFALAHAQARDAVHSALEVNALAAALTARELRHILVQSAAGDRAEYLLRPDLGRTLSQASMGLLHPSAEVTPEAPPTLTVVLADGLSADATNRHAVPLLDALLVRLSSSWRLTPILLAQQARVALGDVAGERLGADAVVLLLGERPGLSAPDSLGAYITWGPRAGRTDAERNCVSNIRPGGLEPATAADKIAWYLGEARRLRQTGTSLRESDALELPSR